MNHSCRRSEGFGTRRALFRAAAAWALAAAPLGAADRAAEDRFEHGVRPVLVTQCGPCHGADLAEGGLRLDSREAILAGGASGPAAVPGDADASLLVAAVRGGRGDVVAMPPDARLSSAEQAALALWVAEGLVWPAASPTATAGWNEATIDEARASHWAFRDLAEPEVPECGDPAWAGSAIDRFVRAKLAAAGVEPAPLADPRTLIRRLSYDLTGLPPEPEEVEAFVADPSEEAWLAAIERLLASPHYGEQWGRHWLDLARYADSSGKDENHACGSAWEYRDWVVRALNADLPIDRFLADQIAGDLLPAADDADRFEKLRATGFLQMGQKALAEQDKEKMLLDIADEQLDTIGRGFLGLTLSCARCHDHKFDPVPQADWTALAGILRSTRTMENTAFVSTWLERPLVPESVVAAAADHAARLSGARTLRDATAAPLREALGDAGRDDGWRDRLTEADRLRLLVLDAQVTNLEQTQPAAIPTAMAVTEGDVADLRLHPRGNHLAPGPLVPRGFPRIVPLADVPAPSAGASGRLELARWITHPSQPLTPRNIVNRVWARHFGAGLCRTPDNLGLRGAVPDHPELLDWLAARFVAEGWSLKALHRRILSSRVWRLSADGPSSAIDPENRLLGRHQRRRLAAEELRDSLLAVSGRLDRTVGGTLYNYANREPHVGYYKGPVAYDFPRRTLYLPVVRSVLHDLLDLFDQGGRLTSIAGRDATTVAPQALWLMNAAPPREAAEGVARRESGPDTADDEAFIHRVHRRILGREPGGKDLARSRVLLHSAAADLGDAAAARVVLCHALLIDDEFSHVD